MGSVDTDNLDESLDEGGSWLARVALAVLVLAVSVGGYLWLSRERIAGDLIDDYLAQTGLEASYEIASIGARTQVIENLVVGNPAAPDLTIDRVSVDVAYGLGAPGVGSVTLERPKLYGTYRDGALSFGALDPLLFGESEEASGLPALDIAIRNGGALLETDFGAVGVHLEGSGPLDDGFAGKIAALAPGLGTPGCRAERASAYGDLTTSNGVPRFHGPIRLNSLACEGAAIAAADIGAAISTDAGFSKVEGAFDLTTGALDYDQVSARSLAGRATLSLGEGALVLDHDLSLGGFDAGYAKLASLRADGAVRSARGFSETSWNAAIEGEDLSLAGSSTEALASAREAGEGTLIAPLLAKLERGLSRASRAASLSAEVTARVEGSALSIVVPEANLTSASGKRVLAISRLSWSRPGDAREARLSGNFLSGGADLPQISGRIDQTGSGPLSARLSLAPYAVGTDRIAIPSLSVRGTGASGYAFAGLVKASGAIPVGSIDRLEMPLNGVLNSSGGVSLGAACETVKFEKLVAYDLALDARELKACPGDSGAMLTYASDLSVDVVSDALDLSGELAGSPTQLAASRAKLSYPGGFSLSDVNAVIGEADNAVRLTSAELSGTFDDALEGEFSGATAEIDVVAMDLSEMGGRWSYTNGVLTVADTAFTLTERTEDGIEPRFNPLSSQGARLTLEDGAITALANLDHKATGTPITRVTIAHDLSESTGSALIDVSGLKFGNGLSVQDLSELAKGVIAYTEGIVTGEGRIDWTADEITSTGVFRTDDLDLAAAFGPVEGLKGEVRFSDLINLTTEPDQVITIASINPGIEALGGRVRFSLTDGTIIRVEDGRWPFMGGELIMRPTTLEYGTDKEQYYTFEVIALDAATFVTQMELSNLGATGTFDGAVQIVFDPNGFGRIEEGLLISRAPGGNVSYIGELTYTDMGAISNYAFQSLRSLDFRQMSVSLGGDLAGEIITRFRIDGVSQGEDASRNFVTKRLAKLPIRFNVNVRSENFYELATMVRTFWDPEALPDAVDTGLIPVDSLRGQQRLPSAPTLPPPSDTPSGNSGETQALKPDEPPVQPPESETLP